MKKSLLLLSSLLSLNWLALGTEGLAQKHAALKAIDPSQASYDTAPAPPAAQNPAASSALENPFGSGIQGQPLGPKRTIDNPNPQGASYLREEQSQSAPGIPTQAGQGWSPNNSAADNSIYEKRVARLEQMAFGSPYPEHEVEDRLDHLENEVFSKKNSGMPPERS
ncbi:MAG: hypothetical protein K2X27_17025, partial [Candidatus Obscuribacterales bacterium]|nr:hypothetical protein [Candidatus Obscuribacterales bacterium]